MMPHPQTHPAIVHKSLLIFSKARFTGFLILIAFSTAFAPLIGGDQRNFLVIFTTFLAPLLVILFRLPLTRDALWVLILLLYLSSITLAYDGPSEMSSLVYTAMLAISYVCFASSLHSGLITRDSIITFLRRLILAFGIVSVLQMIASLGGLPVPNLIASKGLWSYNSLSVEPSHLGRVLPISILVYFVLLRGQPGIPNSTLRLLARERKVIAVYFVSILLSGSSLAALTAPLALLFAFPARWLIVVMLCWPVIVLIDLPAFQRGLLFLSVLPTLDLQELAQTDHSATIRVAPALVYFDQMTPDNSEFWFGSGMSAIKVFFAGSIENVGTDIGAGFFPAFLIAFGVIGMGLTVWTFMLRFASFVTLPLISLWAIMFLTAGWNTQLFWYGFMMIRVLHFYAVERGPQGSAHAISAHRQGIIP